MLHIMVKENSTQAGGQSVAATLDSVKAILRRLSYLMLTSEYDTFGKFLPKVCESEQSFISCKKRLIAGSGLGKGVIHSYDTSLSVGAIETAIGTLKANSSLVL